MSALAPPPCPPFMLGVNYWSRAGGPRMWRSERFDAQQVGRELQQMAGIGLHVCRSFAFIPTFVAAGGAVREDALARFETFLDLCSRTGVSTIPTFLVGHMSGENYDFAGQRNRNPYRDAELLRWQEQLVGAVAARCADHPAVLAYLASNEMPYWGGREAAPHVRHWAERMRSALRAYDDERPFGLGDGVMNLNGGQNGFDVPTLAPLVDFLGPHSYYADSDDLRQAYNGEYCVRSLSHTGLPILFEEFGCSSMQVSEANQAIYYRELIHGCLSSGCAGALSWCFSDFELEDEAPYHHHAFELGFGITRADGSEKPVCDELRAIRSLVDRLPAPIVAPKVEAAIIVPSYFNTSYPFSREDRARMRRVLLQAYTLCAKAGIEVELIPEDGDVGRYKLLLAPATQKLRAPTWRRILERVAAGATFYWSYFAGDYDFHQGAWCQCFEELTGNRHALRYGCFDLPEQEVVLEGDAIALRCSTAAAGAAPYPRSWLPIEPLQAAGTRLLASDRQGRPALTALPKGAGRVVFCAYPLEYYLAQAPQINERDQSEQLYQLLAQWSGVFPAVVAEGPAVQARLCHAGDQALLWLTNHSWNDARCVVDTPRGVSLLGGAPALPEGRYAHQLAGKEVRVYALDSDPEASRR